MYKSVSFGLVARDLKLACDLVEIVSPDLPGPTVVSRAFDVVGMAFELEAVGKHGIEGYETHVESVRREWRCAEVEWKDLGLGRRRLEIDGRKVESWGAEWIVVYQVWLTTGEQLELPS